ncbi:hypothetical protein, partial [Burkholderia contaminans]
KGGGFCIGAAEMHGGGMTAWLELQRRMRRSRHLPLSSNSQLSARLMKPIELASHSWLALAEAHIQTSTLPLYLSA